MCTEVTASSSGPAREASGVTEDASSHEDHCFSKCSDECSSCYKVTRTGKPYGTRCECPDSDERTEESEQDHIKPRTESIGPRKVLVWVVCLVGLVLLVAVGVALVINHFGQVTIVPREHGQRRKWMFVERMRTQPQPASQPSNFAFFERLQNIAMGVAGRQFNAEPSHPFHKAFSTLRRLTKERNIHIAAVLFASGLINLATLTIVSLCYRGGV